MSAALALAAALQQAPILEVRGAAGWIPIDSAAPGSPATPSASVGSAIAWTDSAPGVRLGAFTVRTTTARLSNSIGVVDLDPGAWRFALRLTPGRARRTAESWLHADTNLQVAVNTGLFNGEGIPLGLVRLDGVQRAPLQRWLEAVVVLADGALGLTDVAGVAAMPAGASVFQTVPWIVRDGRVVYGGASSRRLSRTHRDRRLALCLTGDGRVRLILSSFEVFGARAGAIPIGLTLPEQAAIVALLGCRDAVALDGGTSAQIAVRVGGDLIRWPGWRRVPLMLVATRR